MIHRLFISQICLSWFFIFATLLSLSSMRCLYGMDGTSDRRYPRFYTKKDSELVDLVLEKIKSIVFILKDTDQKPIEEIDLRIVPENTRIFFPPLEKVPSIELNIYLKRFVRMAPQSSSCYVIIMIYIKRLIDKYGPNVFNQFSCYRIFLAAFVIAAKCFDDIFYADDFYAQVGGVSSDHLRDLQMQFLKILNYNVFVLKEEFDNFLLNAPEVFLFDLGLNIKTDDFLAGLNRELDDFLSEFKKLKIVDQA